MIRLIATDLDGSYVNDQKQFPPHYLEQLSRLLARDVVFVAASGRSQYTLQQNFAPLSEQLYFISDNGAYLSHGSKELFSKPLPPDLVREILTVCATIPDIQVVLCGKKQAYFLKPDDFYAQNLKSYYSETAVVSDLFAVEDALLKIAICDKHGSADHAYPVLKNHFGERLACVVSGPIWMDLMCLGVDKGFALQKLQEKLAVSPAETMAFGDFYNDVGLLKQAYYSFVMENALPDMKQYGRYEAEDNNRWGVMRAIEDYVLHGKPLPPARF